MKTLAQELDLLEDNKRRLTETLREKGLDVDGKKLSEYPQLIEDNLITDYFVPVESVLVKEKGRTAIYAASSPHIKIVDKSLREWTLGEWDAEAQRTNYSLERDRPIGISFNINGKHFILTLEQWYNSGDPYKDITGSYSVTAAADSGINTASLGLRLGWYNLVSLATSLSATTKTYSSKSTGVFGTSQVNCQHGTAGKYRSALVRRTILDNGNLEIFIENTNQTFIIDKEVLNGYSTFNSCDTIKGKDPVKLTDFYIEYEEINRQIYAICSGVSTTQPNGTKKEVTIINSGGEMYFAIDGVSTGLLAKYNTHNNIYSNTIHYTAANLTTVYNMQKTNGVNMNSPEIATPGSRGAEAIAVEGYWYITTPIITYQTSTTTRSNTTYDIPDSPVIDFVKWYRQNTDISFPDKSKLALPTHTELRMIAENISIINSIRQYLFYEGWCDDKTQNLRLTTAAVYNQPLSTSIRLASTVAFVTNTYYGGFPYATSVYSRCYYPLIYEL